MAVGTRSLGRPLVALALATSLALGVEAARDLDVGIPAGSPLDWGQQFPGISPPRVSFLASTQNRERELQREGDRSRSQGPPVASERKSATHSNSILRILTWDIPQHLLWIDNSALRPEEPSSASRSPLRPLPPRYGDTMYWITLAPLFRLLLHPQLLSRAALTAHMLELGDACLPALKAASNETELQPFCTDVRARLHTELRPIPVPCEKLEETPRNSMLKAFAAGELLRHEPYDVSSAFGARLFLLSDVFYPVVADLAAHATSTELQRNAVSALARYDSPEANQRLLLIAASSQDQVVLVRALAGLGRFERHAERLDWSPLIARMQATKDPVLRVAIIGALGRGRVEAAVAPLLESLRSATKSPDADQLEAILGALASMHNSRNADSMRPAVGQLLTSLRANRQRFGLSQKPGPVLADFPDARDARASCIEQLAVLLQVRLASSSQESADLLYAMVGGKEHLRELMGQRFDELFSLITPRSQFQFLQALQAQHDALGLACLNGLANLLDQSQGLSTRSGELATSFATMALELLPPIEQSSLARKLIQSSHPATRLKAWLILERLGDSTLEATCRELLAQLSQSNLETESATQKTTYQKAIQWMSQRELFQPSDALALQRHLVGTPEQELQALVSAEFQAQVRRIVLLAAEGAQKAQLRREIDKLIKLTPLVILDQLLATRSELDVRTRILQFLGGAKAHSMDTPYLQAVEDEISAYVLSGTPRVQQPVIQGVAFEPPVDLRQTILLAMGAMRHPMIIELIHSALTSKDEDLRARAAIAMGMAADARAATRLVSALESKDPFTRLCAAQALQALDIEVPALDWIYATAQTRSAGVELLRASLAPKQAR